MGIEVKEAPLLRLRHRQLVKVRDAGAAEQRLRDYCDFNKRERGYSIRFIPDFARNELELQDDQELNLQMAIRELKESKLLVELLPWRENEMVKKLYANREDDKWLH